MQKLIIKKDKEMSIDLTNAIEILRKYECDDNNRYDKYLYHIHDSSFFDVCVELGLLKDDIRFSTFVKGYIRKYLCDDSVLKFEKYKDESDGCFGNIDYLKSTWNNIGILKYYHCDENGHEDTNYFFAVSSPIEIIKFIKDVKNSDEFKKYNDDYDKYISEQYSPIFEDENANIRKEEQAEQDSYLADIPKEELPPEEEIIEQEEQQEQTENNQFKQKTLIKKGFSQEQIDNLKTALEQHNLFFGSIEAWQNLFSDDIQDNLTITANTKNDCSALIIALQEEGVFDNGIYSLIERNHCFKNNDNSYLTQQDISKNKTDGGKKIKNKYGANTIKITKIVKEVKKGSNVKKQ